MNPLLRERGRGTIGGMAQVEVFCRGLFLVILNGLWSLQRLVGQLDFELKMVWRWFGWNNMASEVYLGMVSVLRKVNSP